MTLLVKRHPFRNLASLPSPSDRFFEESLPFLGLARPFAWEETVRGFYPVVDIRETDTAYEVRAELPGLKKEDLTIEVQGGMLTISGEKRAEGEEKNGLSFNERRYGAFQRSFYVDEKVNAEDIQARCKDGVLEVSVPKRQEARRLVSITEE